MFLNRRLRLTELSLLAIPATLAVLGAALMSLMRKAEVSTDNLQPAILIVGLLFVMHVVLFLRRPASDQVLLPLAGALIALGLTLVSRLAPSYFERQVAWVILGCLLALLIVSLPGSLLWLRRYKYTWAVLGIGLVGTTIVFGVDPNGSGARLWLGFGDYLFQPSEILKILSVFFVASYLDDKQELLSLDTFKFSFLKVPGLPYLMPLLIMWGLSVLLLLGQKDLGPTFLVFGVFLAMLYAASSRPVYVWAGLGLLLLAAFGSYHLIGHAQARIDVWLDPWSDPQGNGYQIVQALVAFASGGILGKGLGFGYPLLIPAVHTDFPMAAIGEEMGLLGTLAIVALYLVFTYRGLKIALEAPDSFQQLLAMGLTVTIGLQALIIIAGNLKLIPLTGITLPFISYGGNSLITNFIILGLLLRISDATRRAT
ncbi:MAG: FtsW/RodA/SpoVE family cell cycle protein [Chloroflexi bacterium]|nr:FtsW/RodA/SpoVE family cell cycle protein [Chloroflexota bacterium]